jgi:hypothetical protein
MITKFTKFLNESRLNEYEVNVKGETFIVKGHYYPGDEPIYYYADGSGYPGSPDNFEILEVLMKDENDNFVPATDEMLKDFNVSYDELEEEVLNQINNY